MNKLGGVVIVALVAGWGASRLMGSRGCGVKERAQGKAEQIKGKVEQVAGKVTGSEETQARGAVDEAKGKAREKIAEIKDDARAVLKEPASI